MPRVTIVLLALCLSALLASCGGGSDVRTDSSDQANTRALAGRIVALATATDPDQVPYADYSGCHYLDDCRFSTPENFEQIPMSPPDVGGEWTGQVLRAVEILDPDEAEARRIDLTERKQTLENALSDLIELIELWNPDPALLAPREYEALRLMLQASVTDLENKLADVVQQLKRIVGSPQRLVVYSHPDALKFGWWRTTPGNPEDARFDTFISGDDRVRRSTIVHGGVRATYEGPAAGLYVTRPSGAGKAREGTFTATVSLTADFETARTISGSVTNFREEGAPLGAWTVDLMSPTFGYEPYRFKGPVGGGADGRTWDNGHWMGGFFQWTVVRDASGNIVRYPAAVLGEFHAATGTPQVGDGDAGFIGLAGAFGAHAKSE